jgi:hypothetical protein
MGALLSLAACGTKDGDSDEVSSWRGEATHLAVTGSYEGMVFDANLEGEAAAGVRCTRYYAPIIGTEPDAEGHYDTSQMYFVMAELGAVIEIDGAPKEFSISYWRHDVSAGNQLQVQARTTGTAIPEGQTWSDMNLYDPGTDFLSGLETAAATGSVSMKLNTGDVDANGIVKSSGRLGAYFDVSWGPDDYLEVSATGDCGAPIIVTWPQAYLLP